LSVQTGVCGHRAWKLELRGGPFDFMLPRVNEKLILRLLHKAGWFFPGHEMYTSGGGFDVARVRSWRPDQYSGASPKAALVILQ